MLTIVEDLLLESPSVWIHLHSFKWQAPLLVFQDKSELQQAFNSSIQRIIRVLKNFHPPNLREVTVDFNFSSFRKLIVKLLHSIFINTKLCATLDKILITFPQPTISFSLWPAWRFAVPLPSHHASTNLSHRHRLWISLFGRFFRALQQRQALSIVEADFCEQTLLFC